jgi:lipopolysaccharide export system protein LptA
MRVSIERLRVGLLVAAGLLVLATAGFLEYGRFRAKHFLTELPKKLGADIRQETNAFTYSQTVKGRTVFTVHAAKAVQHSDGKYTLHDVGIVLYGQGSEQPNRVDRIYGSEFEYDQNAGVIRAMGVVHLDLQAPAAADAKAKMDYAEGKDLKSGKEMGREPGESGEKGDRLIHVKTSGLVFLRQLGVAATDQDIEFEYGGLTGNARGADYNSDTGVLVLQSAVKVNGLEQGKPIVLTAAHAELDRLNRTAILTQAKYVSVGEPTRQTAEAQHAVVHTRPDGSVERLEAQGAVTVTNGNEGRVVADRADVLVNQQNKPESVRMFGGVRYSDDRPERQAKGEAQEAQGMFDGKGQLEHVVLRGAVALHDKENIAAQSGNAAKPLWSERELNAGLVELALVSDASGKTLLRDAKASVDARLNVIDPQKPDVKQGRGATNSTLSGDVLTAHFAGVQGRPYLTQVHGAGHTALKQSNEAGLEETTSGDSLEVKFRQEPQRRQAGQVRPGGVAGAPEGERIATAVQEGNVVMTRRTAKSGAAPDVQHATAQRAEYDGDADKMMLTGGVQLSDAGGTLWADRATMERVSGDATVEGGVKASYRQSVQSEIVHVLAERAELKKASDEALFYGKTGKPARLWQGGSQVEAPVLDFTQKQRGLVARGTGQGAPLAVHTVLVSNTSNSAGKVAAPEAKLRTPGVVRIASREMIYSDEKKEADFTGGVLVESADGKMRGQQAVAYLQATDGGKKEPKKETAAIGPQEGFLGGRVEKVIVTGQIRLEQPGRNAVGEQLIYTAADGMFVLTGGAGAQPKVFDETRGMVTGTELRFHTGDESIVISNGASSESGLRVHTETRVKR